MIIQYVDAPTAAGKAALFLVSGQYRIHLSGPEWKGDGSPKPLPVSIHDDFGHLAPLPGAVDPLK